MGQVPHQPAHGQLLKPVGTAVEGVANPEEPVVPVSQGGEGADATKPAPGLVLWGSSTSYLASHALEASCPGYFLVESDFADWYNSTYGTNPNSISTYFA